MRYFSKFSERELICTFINTWNIVKSFFKDASPVNDNNKPEFCSLLRNISILNENLRFANFDELDLSHIDFSNADLSGTFFIGVNFSHSNFKSANLDTVWWEKSNLSNSNFESAFMECTHLEYCNCRNSIFNKAHLLASVVTGADFSYSSLEQTNFMECDAKKLLSKA